MENYQDLGLKALRCWWGYLLFSLKRKKAEYQDWQWCKEGIKAGNCIDVENCRVFTVKKDLEIYNWKRMALNSGLSGRALR